MIKLTRENGDFRKNKNGLIVSWYIQRNICRFLLLSSSNIKRNMGGQVKKIRTFGASLVSVVSMEKATQPREQVKFICNWRKRASLRP